MNLKYDFLLASFSQIFVTNILVLQDIFQQFYNVDLPSFLKSRSPFGCVKNRKMLKRLGTVSYKWV